MFELYLSKDINGLGLQATKKNSSGKKEREEAHTFLTPVDFRKEKNKNKTNIRYALSLQWGALSIAHHLLERGHESVSPCWPPSVEEGSNHIKLVQCLQAEDSLRASIWNLLPT